MKEEIQQDIKILKKNRTKKNPVSLTKISVGHFTSSRLCQEGLSELEEEVKGLERSSKDEDGC